jgi:hypothetical protein
MCPSDWYGMKRGSHLDTSLIKPSNPSFYFLIFFSFFFSGWREQIAFQRCLSRHWNHYVMSSLMVDILTTYLQTPIIIFFHIKNSLDKWFVICDLDCFIIYKNISQEKEIVIWRRVCNSLRSLSCNYRKTSWIFVLETVFVVIILKNKLKKILLAVVSWV